MTLRCIEGDVALVIYDEDSCSSNIGKLVKVAGPIGYNLDLQKMCWLIEPVKPEPWGCVNSRGQMFKKVVTFACRMEHPDDWLVPLRPEADADAEQLSIPTDIATTCANQAEETLT